MNEQPNRYVKWKEWNPIWYKDQKFYFACSAKQTDNYGDYYLYVDVAEEIEKQGWFKKKVVKQRLRGKFVYKSNKKLKLGGYLNKPADANVRFHVIEATIIELLDEALRSDKTVNQPFVLNCSPELTKL